jgi:hypothetical protein
MFHSRGVLDISFRKSEAPRIDPIIKPVIPRINLAELVNENEKNYD